MLPTLSLLATLAAQQVRTIAGANETTRIANTRSSRQGVQTEPAIEGYYQGAASRLGAITLVSIRLQRMADGSYSGSMDIPDRSRYRDFLSDIKFADGNLSFASRVGKYKLVYHADQSEFVGTSLPNTWNPPVTLDLKRADEPVPQTRVLPFEVRGQGGPIHGALYLPLTGNPFPAVAITHHSDTALHTDSLYASTAEELARRGIAAAVYDKRGGKPEVDLSEQREDLHSVLQWMSKYPEIDKRRLGALGLSQGGWAVIQELSKDTPAKYGVLFVTASVSVPEQERERVEFSMRADGKSQADIDAAVAYTRAMFSCISSNQGWADFDRMRVDTKGKPWADYVDIDTNDSDLESSWWKRNLYDPADDLRRIDRPLYALYGDIDVLVPPSENLPLLQSLDPHAKTKVFARCWHALETYGSLTGANWDWPNVYWSWPHKPVGFWDDVAGWIRDRH